MGDNLIAQPNDAEWLEAIKATNIDITLVFQPPNRKCNTSATFDQIITRAHICALLFFSSRSNQGQLHLLHMITSSNGRR